MRRGAWHDRLGRQAAAAVAVASILVGSVGVEPARADEPGFFGRLFRGGASSEARRSPRGAERNPAKGADPRLGTDPGRDPFSPPGPPNEGNPPALLGNPAGLEGRPVPPGVGDVGAPAVPAPSIPGLDPPPPTTTAAATSAGDGSDSLAPIRPQPRVSRAATDADPLLTRFTIGRTNDGSRFGMFLQVYTDGTVIDSEGVRRVPAEALRPLIQSLQDPDLMKVKGHCGSPPTDFIEQAYVTVYRRKMGGLAANSFSYSGNPAGCDASIRQLHAAVEAFQTRLSPGGSPGSSGAATTSAADAGGLDPATTAAALAPPPAATTGAPLSATPPPALAVPNAPASSLPNPGGDALILNPNGP